MTPLPCPFCGSAASSVQYAAAVFRIKCTAPDCDARGGKGATPEEAAAKWNRRASYAAHLPAVMAATEPEVLDRPLVMVEAVGERSCWNCAHARMLKSSVSDNTSCALRVGTLDYRVNSGAAFSPEGLPTNRDMRCPSWAAKETT